MKQPWRWAVHVREHLRAADVEDAVPVLPDQLVRARQRILGDPVADTLAALEHEHVCTEPFTLDHREEHGALAPLDRLEQPVDGAHSSASTKTSISPPHGKPTSQASSSAMPYDTSRGVPVSSTSRAHS